MALVPVTNLAIPWLASAQKTQVHGDCLDGLKGAQLQKHLAGSDKTGSGSNKKPALHYKHWRKVQLPESESRQHLALCPLSEHLARRAALPSPSSQALPAARPTDPTLGPAATEEVRRIVHDARPRPLYSPTFRVEIGARMLRWRPDFDAAPPSHRRRCPARGRPTRPRRLLRA